MKGLEEARRFYETFGRDMLHRDFPDFEGRVAVGLAGRGSECFGFDDALSRDHDFEEGFCLWLTDADDLLIGEALSEAYRALPMRKASQRSRLGESNRGVRRIGFFYRSRIGSEGAPRDWRQWLALPSWALAEATNGAVFRAHPHVVGDGFRFLLGDGGENGDEHLAHLAISIEAHQIAGRATSKQERWLNALRL